MAFIADINPFYDKFKQDYNQAVLNSYEKVFIIKIDEQIRFMGYNSCQYKSHPDKKSTGWYMDDNEFNLFVLRYS